jgi:hypothetical protein
LTEDFAVTKKRVFREYKATANATAAMKAPGEVTSASTAYKGTRKDMTPRKMSTLRISPCCNHSLAIQIPSALHLFGVTFLVVGLVVAKSFASQSSTRNTMRHLKHVFEKMIRNDFEASNFKRF